MQGQKEMEISFKSSTSLISTPNVWYWSSKTEKSDSVSLNNKIKKKLLCQIYATPKSYLPNRSF